MGRGWAILEGGNRGSVLIRSGAAMIYGDFRIIGGHLRAYSSQMRARCRALAALPNQIPGASHATTLLIRIP
jgi:hypothetical protein